MRSFAFQSRRAVTGVYDETGNVIERTTTRASSPSRARYTVKLRAPIEEHSFFALRRQCSVNVLLDDKLAEMRPTPLRDFKRKLVDQALLGYSRTTVGTLISIGAVWPRQPEITCAISLTQRVLLPSKLPFPRIARENRKGRGSALSRRVNE